MRPPDTSGLRLTPYWWEAAPLDPAGTVETPASADVAIVGAGFAGLAAALALARAGCAVVVFDALRAGEGASTRNGGIASGAVKYAFDDLVARVGMEPAKAIHEEGVAARNSLVDLVDAERIDCGLSFSGRFTGANHPRDYERLAREAEYLNRHLALGAEVVPRTEQRRELGTDLYHGGVTRPDVGGVHPGRLHAGMLRAVRAAGAVVAGGTAVNGIERSGEGLHVRHARGALAVREAVVATNGYSGRAVPWLQRRVIAVPSQIIATEALEPALMERLMPKRRMVGDTRNLYNYYRPTPDGTGIVFGGRRGADTDDARKKTAHLYRNLVEIFPELEGVRLSHSWWGYTGYTFDSLPRLAAHDGVRYATGFCGSGVVWAPWLGRKVAAAILGDEAGARTAFDTPFQTRPLYAGRAWFLPWVIGWYGLKDRLGFGRRS